MSITPFPSQGQYPWYDQLEQWGADTQSAAESAELNADGLRADVATALADSTAASAAAIAAAGLVDAPAGEAVLAAISEDGAAREELLATINPIALGSLPFLPVLDVRDDAALTGPRWIESIDGVLFGALGPTLSRTATRDGGWMAVHTFPTSETITGIKATGDGEVIVAQGGNGIWKSSGWSHNQLTATWVKTLDTFGAPVVPFSFNVDEGSGWVGVTTYVSGTDMSNSRYMWLSKDRGQTFEVIYDKVQAHPEVAAATSHMHTIAFDPYHNTHTPRIWGVWHKTTDDPTVTSDPRNYVMYSDDAGSTWTEYSTTDLHGTIAIATPAGMVMDTDYPPTALYIVERDSMERKLLYRRRTTATIDGLWGWAAKAIPSSDGLGAHVAFRSSKPGTPAGVVSTDGVRATETFTIEPATPSDTVNIVDITTHKGELLGTFTQTESSPSVRGGFYGLEPSRGVSGIEDNGISGGLAGDMSVAVGLGSSAENVRSIAAGFNSTALRDATAVGHNANASTLGTSVGTGSTAGANTVAVGHAASSTGSNSVVVGDASSAPSRAVVIGKGAVATSNEATTVGYLATSGNNSVGVGHGAVANGTGAVGVGASSVAVTSGTAVGNAAKANGNGSVAIGKDATSSSTGVAVGQGASSTHSSSAALGAGAQTTSTNQIAVGPRHLELNEIEAPVRPLTGGARLFLQDNGAGKTQMVIQFATGTVQVLATEE